MKTAHVKIDDETREILRRSVLTQKRNDFTVKLPPATLDRDLYVRVAKVLNALGGTWERHAAGFVFASDPSAALEEIRTGGEVVDRKKTFQAFFTPAPLADQVAGLAYLQPGQRVLEPSAGEGALLLALGRLRIAFNSTAIEINPDHYGPLMQAANSVMMADFLNLTPDKLSSDGLVGKGGFDRVVMNPPFTRGQDVEHVLHAWKFVRPGGRLVAIVSPSFRFREGKKFEAFREAHEAFGVRSIGRNEEEPGASGVAGELNVPAGAFKDSGTNIATVIVVWDKPEASRAAA